MTTRREFMVGAAGLTFTVLVDGCAAMRTEERSAGASLASAPADGAKTINAWASLSTDGTIYIANPAVEMGPGLADRDPAHHRRGDGRRLVARRHRSGRARRQGLRQPGIPRPDAYGGVGDRDRLLDVARTFGAQVRRVMMENAARKWDVPLAELTTEPSAVVHAKTGRRLELRRDRGLRPNPGNRARDQAGRAEEAGAVPPDRQGRDAGRAAEQGERHGAVQRSTCRFPACSTAPCCAGRSKAHRR